MKFDKSYYKEPELKMFVDLAYNGSLRNQSIYSGNDMVAHRERIPLQQHNRFKTQFYNELLRKAILPKNAQTSVKLFDENGTEIYSPTNLFKLVPEYGSIVFEIEPTTIPKYVECALYDLYTAQDVFLKKDLDEALNINLDLIKASLHSLNSIKIEQGGEPLQELTCNADNKHHPLIIINDKLVTVTTNPFIISPNTDPDNTFIELKWGNLTLFRERLSVVCEGNGNYWRLNTSKDLFETGKETFWLYNSYVLEIPSSAFNSYLGLVGVTPDEFSIRVGDYNVYQIVSENIGLDKFLRNSLNPSISYNEAYFEGLKTAYVSGKRYFPNEDVNYPLAIDVHLENNSYLYYRPFGFYYGVVDQFEDTYIFESLSSNEVLNIPLEVVINKESKSLFIQTVDFEGEILDHYTLDIDCTYAKELENYRIYTPGPEEEFPVESSFHSWDPLHTLESWEPKLWDGEYTCESNESAIAFELNTEGKHYSHLDLDLETDGKVYVKSKGNTGWLNTEEAIDVFNDPVTDNSGCKYSEGSYSFGRVNYNSTILIRVLNAHSIRFQAFQIY